MRYILLLSLLPLLTNCDKMKPCDPCPPNPVDTFKYEGPFNGLWQTVLNPDTTEVVSMKPKVHGNIAAYSMLFYIDGFEFLRAVDATNGNPVWSWNPIWPGEKINHNSKVQQEDKLLVSHFGPLYCIDMNTGQNIWSRKPSLIHPNSTGGATVSVVGDYVYEALRPSGINNHASYMTRTLLTSGKLDTIFAKYEDEGYTPRGCDSHLMYKSVVIYRI